MNRHKHSNPSHKFYGPVTKDLSEIESVLSDLERLRSLPQCEKRDVLIEQCEKYLNPAREKSFHNELSIRYENLQQQVRGILTKSQNRQREVAFRSTNLIRKSLVSLLITRKSKMDIDDHFLKELDKVIVSALDESFRTSNYEELEAFDSAMSRETYLSQTQNIEYL